MALACPGPLPLLEAGGPGEAPPPAARPPVDEVLAHSTEDPPYGEKGLKVRTHCMSLPSCVLGHRQLFQLQLYTRNSVLGSTDGEMWGFPDTPRHLPFSVPCTQLLLSPDVCTS